MSNKQTEPFWNWFNATARIKIGLRAETFIKMFEYLDTLEGPITILETGCVRVKDNWDGDGYSTVLFDEYAKHHTQCKVYTVDIDPEATTLCKNIVSDNVDVHTGDSVAYFHSLTQNPPKGFNLALLYLDSSYDDANTLKEFTAIVPLVRETTLVAVDDSALDFKGLSQDGQMVILEGWPKIGGKAKLLAEYAKQIGAELKFSSYQCGWTKLGCSK